MDGLRRMPLLGRDETSEVWDVHAGRYVPLPGHTQDQLTLLSACACGQVRQLDDEIEAAALFGAPFGPWSGRHLPPWLAASLDGATTRGLRDTAIDLDLVLYRGLPVNPRCTAGALVRVALVRDAEAWGLRLGVPFDARRTARVLGSDQGAALELWSGDAHHAVADLAVLAARGQLGLLPRHWFHTPAELNEDVEQTVRFERRGPAPVPAPATWWRTAITYWASPGPGATAAASPEVSRQRAAARRQRYGLVPAGGAGDVDRLSRWMTGARVRPAWVRWQPVAGGPVRDSEMTVTGLEIDEDGQVLLLAIWHDAAVAVPIPALISLYWVGRGSAGVRSP